MTLINSNSRISYKHSLHQKQCLIYPIQVVTDPEKIKNYHRKKLYELSKPGPGILDFKVDGSVWRDGKPYLEQPSEEQLEWYQGRMRGSAKSWETWDQ